MLIFKSSIFVAAAAAFQLVAAEPIFRPSVSFEGTLEVEASGVRNINLMYSNPPHGELSIFYGNCDISTSDEAHHRIGKTHIGDHELAKRHLDWVDQRPTKFVWMVPANIIEGCLHAYVEDELVGRSESFSVKKRVDRRGTFADVTDAIGPWFDGYVTKPRLRSSLLIDY